MSVPVPPATAFGLTGALAAWADRQLTPQPYGAISTPVSLTGAWQTIPRKTFVRMTDYAAAHFDQAYELASADAGWTAIRRAGPHNVMMTEPDWFVGLLMEHAL